MKACVVFVLAIGAVSSLGSGPYLPSGWKPKGPAFTLPTEVVKISEAPQEDIQAESDASGSDFLREYGPPEIRDIYQIISKQALPDVNTEKAFVLPEAKFTEEEKSVSVKDNQTVVQLRSNVLESIDAKLDEIQPTEIAIEGTPEDNPERTEKSGVEVEKVTESEVSEEGTTEVSPRDTVTNTEVKVNNDSTSEPSVQLNEITKKVAEQVQTTEIVLANELDSPLIPDDIISIDVTNIENVSSHIEQDIEEIKEKEESTSLKEAAEKVDEEAIGFREYGPPKDSADKQKPEAEIIEANETRRRRFTSKFAPAKKH